MTKRELLRKMVNQGRVKAHDAPPTVEDEWEPTFKLRWKKLYRSSSWNDGLVLQQRWRRPVYVIDVISHFDYAWRDVPIEHEPKL